MSTRMTRCIRFDAPAPSSFRFDGRDRVDVRSLARNTDGIDYGRMTADEAARAVIARIGSRPAPTSSSIGIIESMRIRAEESVKGRNRAM